MPALDEVYQSLHEPRRWGAVDDIVVERDRQAEEVTRFDMVLDDGGLACDTAHDEEEGLPRRRQSPAAAATGHA